MNLGHFKPRGGLRAKSKALVTWMVEVLELTKYLKQFPFIELKNPRFFALFTMSLRTLHKMLHGPYNIPKNKNKIKKQEEADLVKEKLTSFQQISLHHFSFPQVPNLLANQRYHYQVVLAIGMKNMSK